MFIHVNNFICFFFTAAAAKVARMLLVLAFCGQIVFMIVADFVYQGFVSLQFAFGITYVLCSVIQVSIIMCGIGTLFFLLPILYISVLLIKFCELNNRLCSLKKKFNCKHFSLLYS